MARERKHTQKKRRDNFRKSLFITKTINYSGAQRIFLLMKFNSKQLPINSSFMAESFNNINADYVFSLFRAAEGPSL